MARVIDLTRVERAAPGIPLRKFARLFATPTGGPVSFPVGPSSSVISPSGPFPQYIIQTNATFSATGYDYGIYSQETGRFDINVFTAVAFIPGTQLEFSITRNGVPIPGAIFITSNPGLIPLKAFNVQISLYDLIQVSVRSLGAPISLSFESNTIELTSV